MWLHCVLKAWLVYKKPSLEGKKEGKEDRQAVSLSSPSTSSLKVGSLGTDRELIFSICRQTF